MDGAYSTHGRDDKYVQNIGKPEEKRPLRRRRRGWKDNIKVDVNEIGK
jgi:hypothetical protein